MRTNYDLESVMISKHQQPPLQQKTENIHPHALNYFDTTYNLLYTINLFDDDLLYMKQKLNTGFTRDTIYSKGHCERFKNHNADVWLYIR